jgi:hypothetical protein
VIRYVSKYIEIYLLNAFLESNIPASVTVSKFGSSVKEVFS